MLCTDHLRLHHYPQESVKLNASFRGWNCPFTTTPVWIVNASIPELAVSVQAAGNAPGVPPRPAGG